MSAPSRDPKWTMYNVLVSGEGGEFMIRVSQHHLIELKKLGRAYMETGEWSEQLNYIIDHSERVTTVGTINTSGDGGGWYENEENK